MSTIYIETEPVAWHFDCPKCGERISKQDTDGGFYDWIGDYEGDCPACGEHVELECEWL